MVVVTCNAPGCDWTSSDRDAALAVILAAELSNHTTTNHLNAPNSPTQTRTNFKPPSIKTDATVDQFKYFLKRWNKFKTLSGVKGEELKAQLMETTSEDLRFAMFKDNPEIESKCEAKILASIEKLAVKNGLSSLKEEFIVKQEVSNERVDAEDEIDVKEGIDLKLEVILEEGAVQEEEFVLKEEKGVDEVKEENVTGHGRRSKRRRLSMKEEGPIGETELYCFVCQVYGHPISNDCVMSPTCFSCGVEGHVRRDCLASSSALNQDENFQIEPQIMSLPQQSHYNYVFIEVETIKASNSSRKQLTQIGCYHFKGARSFFRVIKPEHLDHYVDNFKHILMNDPWSIDSGTAKQLTNKQTNKKNADLLKLLNLHKNESGHYEFRKMFEVTEKEAPQCVEEYEALLSLRDFLGEHCVLFSQLEENIEVVIGRMVNYGINTDFIEGFCTWKHFLKKTGEEEQLEFDDWYKEKSNKPVPEEMNAATVAKMVWDSVLAKIVRESASEGIPDFYNVLLGASMVVDGIVARIPTSDEITDYDRPIECLEFFLEFFSSFRPALPMVITMQITIEHLQTLQVSDDEDGDTGNVNEVTVSDEDGEAKEITILDNFVETDSAIEEVKSSGRVPRLQHECGTCHKKFAFLHSLNSHMKTHQGEAKYSRQTKKVPTLKCNLCLDSPQVFKSSQALDGHRKLHHRQRICRICAARCADKMTYDAHVETHHNKQQRSNLSCPVCACSVKRGLRRHIETHHPAFKDEQYVDWIKSEDIL